MRYASLVVLCALGCTKGAADDSGTPTADLPYVIVDTNQSLCYDNTQSITCPTSGSHYGQDAQYSGAQPSYTDNGDGTITDDNTALIWQQEPSETMPHSDAAAYCDGLELGGRDDWRLPSTKELYSLIEFDGATGTGNPEDSTAPPDADPYLDDGVFGFEYGGADGGRYIDAQYATTTIYVSRVMADNDGLEAGQEAFFGVNFADGRIKGYPTEGGQDWYVRCVAGNTDYGVNDFEDNGDETVTDHATGRMWTRADSGTLGTGVLDWSGALAFCEDLDHAGYDDWRLPNAKELQSLLDYTRSRDTTSSAAIDAVFDATAITDEDGHENYGFYWTGTTHLDGQILGADAVYVAFGEALGYFMGPTTGQDLFLDVHGAGAQRGDPKAGDADDFPVWGGGPQGDVRRVYNLARCVRDAD
ncbi:MAG: DUF1566 domain-containing protein [Alphaproteobacteria bacterium]|nr:DUF1566 domain-containing protein [Alphaproteobacteria bacterium]